MFHIFKLQDIRNRAYVVDNKGNKIFFGTLYQCSKFIEYMVKGENNNGRDQNSRTIRRSGDYVVKT